MVVLYIRIYQVAAKKSKARRRRTHDTLRHLALGGVALHSTLQVQQTPTPLSTNSSAKKSSESNIMTMAEMPVGDDATITHSARPSVSYSVHQKRSEMSLSERISFSASGVVHSLKKTPARSLISLKTEQKAAKTLGIILGSFIACWLPFFILYLSGPVLNYFDLVTPVWVFKLFTWLGYINSSCNPIIYTIFNKEFRQAFQKICCRSHRSMTS